MMDYQKLCKALRRQYGTRLELRAAQAIDELLYQHALDLSEIVKLRRQIEALEEAGA